MTSAQILAAAIFAVGGHVAGHVYFRLLGRTVAAITEGKTGASAIVTVLLRVAITAATFAIAAAAGGLSLLAALAGFLGARALAFRQIMRACP